MKKVVALLLAISTAISTIPVFATENLEMPREISTSLSDTELLNIYNSENYENEFVPGEIIVALNSQNSGSETILFPGLDIEKIEDIYEPLVDAFENVNLLNAENDTNEEAFNELNEKIGTTYVVTLSSKDKESVLDAIEILKENPNVAYAEPNYISEPESIPNDSEYNMLWGMDKIQAPQAWDITTGSHLVKIGILDSGFDYTHPDLADNLDMELAYNAAKQSNSEMDDYISGHGTHVAGIVGALGDNSLGVTGVNWNVSIVPIKIAVSNTVSSTNSAIQARAVEYASLLELPVISMSYGISYSQTLINTIKDYKGLFIKSAGNSGTNTDNTPMFQELHELGNVLFVAATTSSDTKSSFSCYGVNTVDIAAPGGSNLLNKSDLDILSTYPETMCDNNVVTGTHYSRGYHYMPGTSMAAPHVAGAAALILSVNPNLTTQELKSVLLNSVDIIPALSNYVSTSGRLNVYKAIKAVYSDITLKIHDLSFDKLFTLNSVDLSSKGSHKNSNVHIVVNKYNISNVKLDSVSASINMDSSGNGKYENIPSNVKLNSSSEHLEIEVYKDDSCKNLITRQLVYPLMFSFD